VQLNERGRRSVGRDCFLVGLGTSHSAIIVLHFVLQSFVPEGGVIASLQSHRLANVTGLWDTRGVAKHKFMVAERDAEGNLIGSRCIRCGRIALSKTLPRGDD
jgi:hypothetical protein